jgi:CobQ-like glutamine amidotransferase family enzyme
VHSLKTDEATVRCEEEVSIRTCQTREHVKGGTIYCYENRGRKTRLGKELDPVDVVVIGHGSLNYPIPSNDSHLYTWGTVTEVSLWGILASNKTMGRIARMWD